MNKISISFWKILIHISHDFSWHNDLFYVQKGKELYIPIIIYVS